MKVHLSELTVNSCFIHGRKRKVSKKVEDGKVSTIGKGGRVSTRVVKGDPEVEPEVCPLRYLGVGQRAHPDQMVEIGDGNILHPKKRRG